MTASQGNEQKVGRVLVTGGGGFLGHAIVRELRRPESAIESIRLLDLDLGDSPERDGVEMLGGDICDYPRVVEACRGVDVVLHAASLVDWGQATPERVEQVNVGGTDNLLRACRENGVAALVYTSTMDVVCGTSPVVDADETTPYPARFTNEYARTKALAEQRVLAANGPRLATCALRPCGMFGEGDPYHVENVLRIVKEGGLPFRPGNGSARFQHVYVGNVAHAHALAMRRLLAGDAAVAGQAYFITDDCPAVNFFDFLEPILTALGHSLPPKSRSVPYPVMLALAASMEAASLLCRPFFRMNPTLTRSSVRFTCHDHTFDGSKARRDLGYAPRYKEAESLERTIDYFRAREAGEGVGSLTQ